MVEEEKPARGPRTSSYRERNSTADRALDILGMFTPTRTSVSAIEVASKLSVARSTAYRYLLTLSAAGYLEEDPASGFRLGLKVFELARIARGSYGLSELALPILRDLVRSTNETALLTRRSGNRTVCLEREEPVGYLVRLSYDRGAVLPLNAGASSMVLLAWEDPDAVHEILRGFEFPRFTDNSLTSEKQIVDRLAEIRTLGYSVSRGELDPDAIGIAAPVCDDQNRVVAGISVVAISRRVEGKEDEVVAEVRQAAERLTEMVSRTSH